MYLSSDVSNRAQKETSGDAENRPFLQIFLEKERVGKTKIY
jgi:hypothetical protein